ncbi:MAG: Lrp/AsnC family transcriptional regulator [Reyranellaceae bacterium]
MTTIALDSFDIRLLDALQRDGRASLFALAEKIGLSASQLGRRLKRLEESGLMEGYAALLNAEEIGLGFEAYCLVSLERHSSEGTERFHDAMRALPQIMDCVAVTGEADFILRIVATDLKAYSQFLLDEIMPLPGIRQVRSSIVLRPIKRSHALPLAHLRV